MIVVIGNEFSKQVGSQIKRFVEVQCECGKVFTVRKQHAAKQKSCGCMVVKHGQSGKNRTIEYKTWESMKTRCNGPNYKYYAQRGIGVCERWSESFEAFFEDMGERPKGHTLDRIDNSKGYSPDNCRWATRKTQQRNRRTTVMVEIYGKTMSLPEWCDISGVDLELARQRIRYGWTPKQAVFGKAQP